MPASHPFSSGAAPAQAAKPAVDPPTSLVATNAKIGLALSGGGIRAAVFHLGVLKWLAELGFLENLRHISTVSGASLAMALVYAKSDYRFPDSRTYLEKTLPLIRDTILRHDIQDRALYSLTVMPWLARRKVNLVADAATRLWDIRGAVADLPPDPLWSINCTTFETGKDFRISQNGMGDYKIGYVFDPNFSIADAAAASAGFPVLIGPYRLKMKGCGLQSSDDNRPSPHCASSRSIHLWDGGVYDNLGLEALYKISQNGHLTSGINHLIISNASSPEGCRRRDFFSPVGNLRRLLSITMDQVNALRSRDVIDYLERTGNGSYLRIGGIPQGGGTLTQEEVLRVKHYPTTLSSPSADDFDLILRHGCETAAEKIDTP